MNILGSQKTCSHCGARVKKGSTFCHVCGKPLGDGTIKCGQCHRSIPADAKFCPHCGNTISSVAPPKITDNRWQKQADDFATRVEVGDLKGFLRRHLTIEPGTRAIFLVDGANVGTVPPGKYSIDDLSQKFLKAINLGTGKSIVAILIDDGPCELSFEIPKLFTQDPMQIGFTCNLVVKLNESGDAPFQFMNAMLKSRRSFSLVDLRAYLFPEIQDVAQSWLATRNIETLNSSIGLKKEMEQHIEMALGQTFQRVGLQFEALRTLNFAHEKWDAIRQQNEKYYLQFEEETADLAGRKLLFDVFDERELQDIFEETKKVEHYEKRAAVWARMRDAVLSDKMDELRSEDEMEAFLRERDREKLITDTEWEELKRTYRENAEDHTRARAHLVALTEMKNQFELESEQLVLDRDLSAAQFEVRQETIRRELTRVQELEWQRWEHRIKIEQQTAAIRRQEEKEEAIHSRQIELDNIRQTLMLVKETAETVAEIRTIKREEDRLDIELGLATKEKMQALKLKRKSEELELELRAESERLKLKMAHERQQAELAQQAKDAEHTFELKRIEKMATLSAEALISLSGAPQAEMIADLKKTEALKGMDADAILAMAADKSPKVAEAFAEKFKAIAQGQASQRERELFEKMLAQQDAGAARTLKSMEDSARRESETARHAIDRTADIAKEYARAGGGQSPTVIYPPQGNVGGTVIGGGSVNYAGGEVVICPKCQTKSQPGTQFCHNCGHRFFDR